LEAGRPEKADHPGQPRSIRTVASYEGGRNRNLKNEDWGLVIQIAEIGGKKEVTLDCRKIPQGPGITDLGVKGNQAQSLIGRVLNVVIMKQAALKPHAFGTR